MLNRGVGQRFLEPGIALDEQVRGGRAGRVRVHAGQGILPLIAKVFVDFGRPYFQSVENSSLRRSAQKRHRLSAEVCLKHAGRVAVAGDQVEHLLLGGELQLANGFIAGLLRLRLLVLRGHLHTCCNYTKLKCPPDRLY